MLSIHVPMTAILPQLDGCQLVVFDFDHTLVDLPVDWVGLRADLTEAGIDVGGSLAELYRNLRNDDPLAFERACWLRYQRERDAACSVSWREGAPMLLRRLDDRRTVILTRNCHAAVESALYVAGVRTCVSLIVGAESGAKDDPAIFGRLAEWFDCDKDRIAYVAEADGEREFAESAGVTFVRVEAFRCNEFVS